MYVGHAPPARPTGRHTRGAVTRMAGRASRSATKPRVGAGGLLENQYRDNEAAILEWASPPTVADSGKVCHTSVHIGEGEQRWTLQVGDSVYLTPELVRQNEPCEMAYVLSMYVDEDGEKAMTIRWFWRPHMVHGLGALKPDEKPKDREVFFSVDESANQPIEAIERYDFPLESPRSDRAPQIRFALAGAASLLS